MAVAIREKGFKSIKIYNGGLKDWISSGYEVESTLALPEYGGGVIEAEELRALIERADQQGCVDEKGKPLFVILDYRTELFTKSDKPGQRIKTSCPTITMLLDDFADPEARAKIPKDVKVILVCETGNRDSFAMQYLYSYGYTNVVGLRFGMRAWIKAGYPVVE